MVLLGLAGAIAVASADAEPTGLALIDQVYTGAVGATMVWAGSRSRRYAWLASSLAAVWLAPDAPLRVVAIVLVGVALVSVATTRRRWVGAALTAGLVFVLARLGDGPFHASTICLAVLAGAPILISALRRLPSSRTKAVTRAGLAVAAAAVFASSLFGLAALLSIDDINEAVEQATSGLELAGDGNQDQAAAALVRAESSFESARRLVGGIWSAPARLVPVVGQHVKAVQVATSEGVSLTSTAYEAATTVDVDDVRIEDGAVDLDLLDRLAPVLGRAENALVRAHDRLSEAESPWLVAPVADRMDELIDELEEARPSAETAALAVRELPVLMGRNQPVHWLVLATTPAEARGLGGLVGNYLVIEAHEGRVDVVEAGRNEDLNGLLRAENATLFGPQQYVDRWGAFEVERFFQDVTLEPDLPSVAVVAADLYEQATGVSIEGVVTVDPYAIEAILELTGPVAAGAMRLSSSNVADFLLVDQYSAFDSEAERVAVLDELVTNTFAGFTDGGLPGPRGLASAIGSVVEEDRLAMWWLGGGSPTDLIVRTGLDASFPTPDNGDLIGVVHQNAGQNKTDTFLERSLDYRLEVDDGRASGTATVTLTNRAPTSGLPDSVIGSNDQGLPLGSNLARVDLHTALDVVKMSVDGVETPITRKTAFEAEAAGTTIEILAGETVTVTYELRGRVDGDYSLTVVQQPLVGVETVNVEVVIDGVERLTLDDHELRRDLRLTSNVTE